MAIRITKPFSTLTSKNIGEISANLGVFELADEAGGIVYIGYAGGRSLFGLRGELIDLLERTGATRFRIEITSAYLTRYQELLMVYKADFGHLPIENSERDNDNLGRLSPGFHKP